MEDRSVRSRRIGFELLEDRNLLSASPTNVVVDPPVAEVGSYMLTDNWGGTWSDVEKSPSSTEDDLLCWAAAASNILEWTGWAEGMNTGTTGDESFQYFQDHWTDQGGMMQYAWDWWYDGSNPSQGWSGWAQVDVEGGNFYPEENFYDYFHTQGNDAAAMVAIDDYLHAGYGTTVGIYGPGGHAITIWGYDYDVETGEYLGLWITDSDDNKNVDDAPDLMRYYDVENVNNRWHLQSYYGSNSWYIGVVQGLESFDPTPTDPPPPPSEIHGTVFDDTNSNGTQDVGELGREGDTVFIDTNGNGSYDNSNFESDDPVDIIDAGIVTSTLEVDDGPASIEDVNVNLDIQHSWTGDLVISLISPSGVDVLLMAYVGASGSNFTDTTLDDESSISILSGTSPFTGSFRPMMPLSTFDGEDSNGTWTLEINDTAAFDTGTLLNWSLDFGHSDIATTTDASGSFSFTDLSDGSYIVAHTSDLMADGFYVIDVADSSIVSDVNFGIPPILSDVSVYGTDLDDQFVYESGRVTLNGIPFSVGLPSVGFYGGGGINTIELLPPTPPVFDFVDEILRNTPVDLLELLLWEGGN